MTYTSVNCKIVCKNLDVTPCSIFSHITRVLNSTLCFAKGDLLPIPYRLQSVLTVLHQLDDIIWSPTVVH